MKLARMTAAMAAALALSGCALSSYCEGEMDYQRAPSVPPLHTAEGLQLPESGSALRIPPPPANPVPYGEKYKDADGDDAVRCLDRPPELARPAEPEAPAAPAAPAEGQPAG
jgi:hypothetical protein